MLLCLYHKSRTGVHTMPTKYSLDTKIAARNLLCRRSASARPTRPARSVGSPVPSLTVFARFSETPLHRRPFGGQEVKSRCPRCCRSVSTRPSVVKISLCSLSLCGELKMYEPRQRAIPARPTTRNPMPPCHKISLCLSKCK